MFESKSAVLEMRGICKRFPGTDALLDVGLRVLEKEIVGLVGENGAGKSTLVKILIGLYSADGGEIILHGRNVRPSSVREAENLGIGMVFQEQAALENLTVAENVYLGAEHIFERRGLISHKKMNDATRAILLELGSPLSPSASVASLSFVDRQTVEFARALAVAGMSEKHPVIVLDEPTSLGTAADVERLFQMMRNLKEYGSLIFISHRLDEILTITDRVYVMKDGRNVCDMPTSLATEAELHRLMVGREVSTEYYRENEQAAASSEVVLSLRNCSLAGQFKDVTFDLHRGEILGVTGVAGSGREALCRSIGGVMPLTSGEVYVEGHRVSLDSPIEATKLKIAYMPIDRRAESLIQYMSIAKNVTLAAREEVVEHGILSSSRENKVVDDWASRLKIKAPNWKALVSTLSGGNQQKVVLAKWLAAGSKIIVMDHPTRGIDVGAKEEIYAWIRKLVGEGHSILLSGDTLGEVVGLSNRVIAMKDGEVGHIFDASAGNKPDQVEVVSYLL